MRRTFAAVQALLLCFVFDSYHLSYLEFVLPAFPGMQGAHYVISTVGKPDYVETPDTMDILMPYLNGGKSPDAAGSRIPRRAPIPPIE